MTEQVTTENPAWRCFHCDENFTDATQAEQHFGRTQLADPVCQIDAEKYREMEALVARYREEDTDLHREIHRLHNDHGVALRREEEKGYARGLKDAFGLTSPAPGQPAAPAQSPDDVVNGAGNHACDGATAAVLKPEAASHESETIFDPSAPVSQGPVRAALAELVRLKDLEAHLQARLKAGSLLSDAEEAQYQRRRADYLANSPKAWDAARAALARPHNSGDEARCRAIGAAVLRACSELPDGYSVALHLEYGYGGARLIDPEGHETDLDEADADRELAIEIMAGINDARARCADCGIPNS